MVGLRLNAFKGRTRSARGLRPGMSRLDREPRSEPGGVHSGEKSRFSMHERDERELRRPRPRASRGYVCMHMVRGSLSEGWSD